MAYGPAEAFLPQQFSQLYDINVLGTQRVNRAALPELRKQGKGLLLWVGSSSTRGGTPPYLAPYFAAKAAMDAVAVSYAAELSRWGIESSILVPGAFTKGTQHFINSGKPADTERERAYTLDGPTAGLETEVLKGLADCEPEDADVMDDALLAGERAKAKKPGDWEIVGKPQSEEAYGCMLRKNDPEFKKLVDETIAHAQTSGEAEKWFEVWFKQPIPPKNLNMNFDLSDEMKATFKEPNDKALN